MSLTRLFVRRPTLVTVFIALVLLAGIVSEINLVKQQFPNYDVPSVQVLVTYNGASTSEMRDAIVRPLEDNIAGAPDLDHIETAIEPGQATITAVYSLTSDVDTDLVQTQGRVQASQRQLPNDLQAPTISVYNPNEAVVVSLAVGSQTMQPGELSSLVANKIIPSLEQVPGVSYVEANGIVTPSIQVDVHPKALSSSGFTLTDIVSAIANNNVRAPGGIAYGPNRETNIDIRGDVQTPETVADLLLGSPSNTPSATTADPWTFSDRLMRVGDVAAVSDAYETQRVFAFAHGAPIVTLDVQKATGASEVTASQAVQAALPMLRRQYPSVTFNVLNVQATYTQQQLSQVMRTLIEAVIFTGIVMLFFLRSWRNAVVVMIAIPTSLLVTLSVMKLANFTIDTVSMLAMTLIIGILVDDSIVVLENVERQYQDGEDPETAAVEGRNEIGVAAIVITLVDVVVFLPLSFLPGTVGLSLREFGLVVTAATLTSLFVSFTVTPTLAGRWSLLSAWRPWWIVNAFTEGFERLRMWYVDRALGWGLRNRALVVIVSVVSLVAAVALLPFGFVGFEYIPGVDRGELYLTVNYPTGTPLATTQRAMRQVEQYVDGERAVADETTLAGAYVGSLSGYIDNGAVGQMDIFLHDNRRVSTANFASQLQQHVAHMLAQATVVAVPATSTSGGIEQPIDVVVSSYTGDPNAEAARVAVAMAATPGAIDVTSSGSQLSPQVEVQFNRDRARALDASVGTASTAVRSAYGGDIATQFTGTNGLKDVDVTYPQNDQQGLSAIAAIPIRANNGSIIHVGDIASLANVPAPPLIMRINRQNVVYIGANVAPGYELSNVQRAFDQRLKRLHLSSDVTVAAVAGGNQQNVHDTVVGMSAALALSVLLVYLLMVALYNSYRTPFIIMFSVPVAVVGALGALAVTHETLNLFSLIGSVLLIGLVTKNGILLVDFANRLRREGLSRSAAIRESARERFRPIIMTTVSMIAGMTPLALSLDPGADAERSLGIVVIGGLSSSLVLTLLLVPVVYLWVSPRNLAEVQSEDGQMPLPLDGSRAQHGSATPA